MKIATFNMRNFYDAGTFVDSESEEAVTEDFFNERVTYFTEFFRPLDLDVICLQEVGGEHGVTRIGDGLGYNYFFARPNKRGIRMAVLYKKDIDGVKCESVSLGDLHIPSIHENGDTDALAPISQRRDILSFDFDYQGKKLRAVTFHLKSLHPEYLEGEDKENDRKAHADAKFRCIFYKMMEMRALRTYADKSLDEGRHVIFLGDFNENNNASSMDILKSSNKEEAMLYDVLVGYEGNRTTHIHRGNSLTFDTAVVSAGIKDMIASVSIENSNLKDWSVPPPGKLEFEVQGTESDHALVWVILK